MNRQHPKVPRSVGGIRTPRLTVSQILFEAESKALLVIRISDHCICSYRLKGRGAYISNAKAPEKMPAMKTAFLRMMDL